MLAADLVPAQPSPFDGWAAAETLQLLQGARRFRPQLIARFVLNRCVARTLIASEIAEALAKHDPPALASQVGQRVVFANAARGGRLISEMPRSEPAAREVAALAAEIERIAR
jgi:chromosome partitioning protein